MYVRLGVVGVVGSLYSFCFAANGMLLEHVKYAVKPQNLNINNIR